MKLHQFCIMMIVVLLIFWAFKVEAHDWYETRCCSGGDCQPAPIGSVELTDGGWFVHRGIRNPNGAVLRNDDFISFNDNRIKPLPDSAPRGTGMHICTNHLRVICVYVDSGF